MKQKLIKLNRLINHHKKGALILEYCLLLMACVGIALLIQQTVSLDSNVDDSGWVITTWMGIIETIAND